MVVSKLADYENFSQWNNFLVKNFDIHCEPPGGHNTHN